MLSLASVAVPEPQPGLNLNVPESMHAGVYADRALVWHNEHGFTIDFVVPMMPPTPGEDGTMTQQATVAARVRLPVSVMFQLARAIAENVSQYEAKHGAIPAGGPTHPPTEQS